jgi:hypothetical protein
MANLEEKKKSDLKICLKKEVASQRASEGSSEQATGSERERTEAIEKAQQKQNI